MTDASCRYPAWYDHAIATDILLYGQRLAARRLLVNTLGNIAIRSACASLAREVIYTKPRGLSLEECRREHIVVLDVESDALLHGTVRPSPGHRMHREIMRLRPDVQATLHLHPDDVIAFFAVMRWRSMKYVSNDTAMVMGQPPTILEEGVNLELDIRAIARCVAQTNCIVMPGHGITTFGRNISEAFHRAVAFTAEVGRLITSLQLATATGLGVRYADEQAVEQWYREGESVIHGEGGR